uniref:Uncharacterized protein n=1 Tax=Acrobeloides nanus TaxID=290746 RepID=A0A914DWP5_9BILA
METRFSKRLYRAFPGKILNPSFWIRILTLDSEPGLWTLNSDSESGFRFRFRIQNPKSRFRIRLQIPNPDLESESEFLDSDPDFGF